MTRPQTRPKNLRGQSHSLRQLGTFRDGNDNKTTAKWHKSITKQHRNDHKETKNDEKGIQRGHRDKKNENNEKKTGPQGDTSDYQESQMTTESKKNDRDISPLCNLFHFPFNFCTSYNIYYYLSRILVPRTTAVTSLKQMGLVCSFSQLWKGIQRRHVLKIYNTEIDIGLCLQLEMSFKQFYRWLFNNSHLWVKGWAPFVIILYTQAIAAGLCCLLLIKLTRVLF